MSFANFDLEAQKQPLVNNDENNRSSTLNSISNKLSDLIANISKFDKLHQQLGTKRDNSTLRQTLINLNKKCNSLNGEINKILDELNLQNSSNSSSTNSTLLYTQEKLKSQCQDVFKNYQIIQRSYNEKLQSVMINEEYNKNETSQKQLLLDNQLSSTNKDSESTPLLQQQQMQQQKQIQQPQITNHELEYHSTLISQRQNAITSISKGVQDINKIFKDLDEMVNQQGEQIDTIEDNIMAYTNDNQLATIELTKADNYQKKKRKWSCILLVALVVVLVIVLALLS